MSFGIGVGDVLAVGALAKQIYREIYTVARGAPESVQLLVKEIAALSQSIEFLSEEVKDPDSVLRCAGVARCQAVNGLIGEVMKTLQSMDNVAKRNRMVNDGAGRSKIKRSWDKIKWAKDAPLADSLRAELAYHNGRLSLLLTMTQNSSLERIESQNRRITSSIEGIQSLLADTPETPIISMVEGRIFQLTLSQHLMKEGEKVRPWLTTGIHKWVQAGKWWLMKAQLQLRTLSTNDEFVPVQAYTDLVKSSWILIDIISKHPHQKLFSSTSEALEVEIFAESLRQEHRKIHDLGLKRPSLKQIEEADLRVWLTGPPAVSLTLRQDEGSLSETRSWQGSGVDIYFYGFGHYQRFNNIPLFPMMECLVIVFLNAPTETVRIVIQPQTGINYATIDVHFEVLATAKWEVPSVDGLWGVIFNERRIYFPNIETLEAFRVVLKSVIFTRYMQPSIDNDLLRVLTILTSVASGDKAVVRYLLNDNALTAGIHSLRICDPHDLLHSTELRGFDSLATEVVTEFLNDTPMDQYVWEHETIIWPPEFWEYYLWVYQMFEVLAALVRWSWFELFVGTSFNTEQTLKKGFTISPVQAVFYMAVQAGNSALAAAILSRDANVDSREALSSIFGKMEHFSNDGYINMTPLQWATFYRQRETVRLLLDRGAEVNVGVGQTISPLHWAAFNRDEDMAEILINAGANINAKNSLGDTALFISIYTGRIRYELSRHNVTRFEPNIVNSWEKFRWRWQENIFDQTAADYDLNMVRFCIRHGADLEIRTEDNQSALCIASETNYAEAVKLLLEHGAKIDNMELGSLDSKGGFGSKYYRQSALIAACTLKSPEIARMLLEHGADVSVKDSWGQTPLHTAAIDGCSSLVSILLSYGADIEAQCRMQRTAADVAVKAGHHHVLKMLLDRGATVRKKYLPDWLLADAHEVRPGRFRTNVVVREPDPSQQAAPEEDTRSLVRRFGSQVLSNRKHKPAPRKLLHEENLAPPIISPLTESNPAFHELKIQNLA